MLTDMISEEELEIKEEQQWYDHRDLEQGKNLTFLFLKKLMQVFCNGRADGTCRNGHLILTFISIERSKVILTQTF